MAKRIVAVVCGGYTAEQNISLLSGEVVYNNMDLNKYQPYKVIVEKDGWFVQPAHMRVDLSDFTFRENDTQIKFDCVFNAIHGSPGEDGKIQGYLDMIGIPYTNCGVATSALTFNKFWTKDVLTDDVFLAKGILVKNNGSDPIVLSDLIIKTFKLPLFVKPNNNGSSYGISKINDFNELQNAINEALKFDDEVLVEEGITGIEVTCGVYRFNGKVVVLPICEIVTANHAFFDYTAKYTTGESDEIIPARISEIESAQVEEYSAKIYNKLNCHGVVRIDYILSGGKPYMLEVNTVPGLSENSIVPKMARAAGLTLPQFFDMLIEESFRK